MSLKKILFIPLAVTIAISTIQNGFSQERIPVKQWFMEQYQYIDPGLEVPPDSLEKLADNWNRATDETAGADKRQQALRNLIRTMVNIQGVSQRYTNSVISSMVAQFQSIEGRAVPPSRTIKGTRENINYDHVRPVGNGDTDIILLSDIFTDVSIYNSFIEQNRQHYRFHSLNLPGVGEMPPLPLPDRRSYASAPWLSKIEQAVADYIVDNNIEQPVIVGSWGSGYLAARLALNRPELVGKAVLLNAPINILFLFDFTNPTALSPVQARIAYLNNEIPNIFPYPDQNTRRETALGLAGFYTSDSNARSLLAENQSRVDPRVLDQYVGELMAQDYSKSLHKLKVPLLSVTTKHEPNGQLGSGGFQLISGEWEKVMIDHPEAPIDHVVLEDTRTYIAMDDPKALSETLGGYIDGQVIDSKDADPANRGYQLSPRKLVRGMIGATPIEIDHGSPSVRGREIYGNVVRYGTPWRVGANAITSITFYKDLEIEGEDIPRGRYGFFVIPRENQPWQVMLTGYSYGFGGGPFSYDSSYAYKSFEINPVNGPPEEHLRYFVDQKDPLHGVMGFTWAGKRIEMNVKAPANIEVAADAPLSSLRKMNWTLLTNESEADANNAALADAKRVSYHFDESTGHIWFKIELHKRVDHTNVGMNLVVDSDRDQSTGSSWWGRSNSSFMYDRLGTLFVNKTATGPYAGTVGVGRDEFITSGDMTHDASSNIQFAVDKDQSIWYAGLPARDLDPDGRFSLSIAVGSSSAWNDDIPNSGSLAIELPLTGSK